MNKNKMNNEMVTNNNGVNEITAFNNEQFGEVRTLVIDNAPWFVGKDVAEILGYKNASKALADHVDEEDKLNNESLLSLGQRGGWIINESGLYSLILSSKMPKAKEFKHWVTSEILPSIRKHGAYLTVATLEQVMTDPQSWITLLTKLQEEREAKEQLQLKVEQDKPKVLFADSVDVSATTISVADMAKLLKQNGIEIGSKRLFKWLRENGYLIKSKSSDYNHPTQHSMENGLFEIKEYKHINRNGEVILKFTPKVTVKGQKHFINRFLGENYVHYRI